MMKEEDIFKSLERLFGLDITANISVNRKDREIGAIKKVHFERTVVCIECNGMRTTDNSAIERCTKCNGTGRKKKKITPTFLGDMETSQRCDECAGAGKIIEHKCACCKGEGVTKTLDEVEMKIDQNVPPEHKIECKGNTIIQGENISVGDLIIHVRRKKILWFEL